MKKYFMGFIAGAILMTGVTAFADTAKEYMLTNLKFPVILNGKEFKNDELPFLNYNGNTYVPLKITGDLLGVPVKWNDVLRRVEIGNMPIENDLGIELLHDYLKDAKHSAIKYEGEIYLTIVDGSTKYGLSPVWNYEKKELTFEHTQVKARNNVNMSKGVDTLTYLGLTYVKESIYISAKNEVQTNMKNLEEQLEKEYSNFKLMFKVEHKTLTSDNEVYIQANAKGTSVKDLEEFFEYFNQLGEVAKLLFEKYAIELQQQNPQFPLAIRFNYYGYKNHFLGDASVNQDGTIKNSSVWKIVNPNPDAITLN